MEISAAVKPLPQLRRPDPEAMHAQEEECFLHLPAAGAVQGGSSEAQGMDAGVACATHTTRVSSVFFVPSCIPGRCCMPRGQGAAGVWSVEPELLW